MKKIFSFGSRKGLSPSRASATPRRDSGVGKAAPGSGYSTRDRDLGKLHKAASTGDVAKVQQLLLLRKHDLNETDKMNRTPLHLACASGYPDVVSLLVDRKCKVNVWDSDNRTPLIKAVQCQHEECVTILLEHGADPNLVDNNSNTALHYAASGDNTALAGKLLQHRAEIEVKNKEGYTPLLLAVTENKQEMVDFFLKNGADVNASDKSKRTALMIAVSGEPTGIVNLLLQYDVDLSCQDIYGWTAEEYAIVSCYPVHRQLINQYGTQKKLNQPPSPQIRSPDRALATGFTLGGPAMDKEEIQESPRQTSRTRISGKVLEESSPEESVSRLSDKPGADDSWPTTDDEELDFSIKKLPKPNLTKLITASQQISKNALHEDGKDFINGSPQQSHQNKMHGILNVEDHAALMSPNNSHKNCQEKERLERNQEEEQLEDYEDEVEEEEESEEEEEEEFSQDDQDDIDGEEESEYVNTEDEEDYENMKEKEDLNNHHNLSLHTVKYDKSEVKSKISKEKQVKNSTMEFPVPITADLYGNLNANLQATSLKEELTESQEEEKEDNELIGISTREQTQHETLDIPSKLQAPIISQKYAVRKDMMSALGLEEEEDTDSPWDSECTSDSLLKGSARHISAVTNQGLKDNSSKGQLEDVFYIPSFMNGSRNFKMDKLADTRSIGNPVGNIGNPERCSNFKPIQPSIEMKDSFTKQEIEKEIKEKQKSDLMEEFGLDDADDIDDASDWDSTSASQKNVTCRNSKDLNFGGNYPCKSLPLAPSQPRSTEIPLKEDEIVEATAGDGARPGPCLRVVIPVEEPIPQKPCEAQPSGEKEESKDLTQELEFKESSEDSQESFDKSDQEKEKLILETARIPEQRAPKRQINPVLYLKTMTQGPESKEESNNNDVPLDANLNWEERYEKMWVEKEKMEVKKNFKIITTELKQMFGEIYEEDKVTHKPIEELKEELQDGFEDESNQLQKEIPNLTNNSSDAEEREQYGGSLDVAFQSFPEQREYSLENTILHYLKLTSQETLRQSSFKPCSNSSNLHHENDHKPKIECTSTVNEEDVAYDSENVKTASSKIAANEMKEAGIFGMQMEESLDRDTTNLGSDSGYLLQPTGLGSHLGVQLTCTDNMKPIIQEKKPKLSASSKFNEKTELKEHFFQNLINDDYSASNSKSEFGHWGHSLPYSDKTSKMCLEEELQRDLQRFRNEVGMLQVELRALEKEKIQLQTEVEEEKKKHHHNEKETIKGKDGDKLTKHILIGKNNQLLFSVNNNQYGREEENKIPGEEIPVMSISSSKENSAPALLLKGDAMKTIHERNEVKVQMDIDEPDDLTQSSDTTSEGYDLPTSNCKNVMLLIEQLSVDCKDTISLLKIQDAVLTYERSIDIKKGRCTLLRGKVKSLENKISGLQEELSETREMKSRLEHEKIEWDRELCRLRFTLKQEEEKRLSAEKLFEKIRDQLRRKEEQYSKETELKQQLELTLRTLDLELRTVKNNLKQIEEERNDTQRQLSRELSARALQEGILNNHLWKQREREAAAPKMIQSSEFPDSHEKEKELLHKNHTLQEEIARLKLELDTVKMKNQEKENRYTEENEVLQEKNDELQKHLKLNEEAIFQYNGQLNVLTTENVILNSKLENEKQNRDRLETEIESYRSRLTSAVHDHERSQTSKLDLEHTFQREREEWLRLQDKLNYDLSTLKDTNGVLSQQLSKAESKANSLENELHFVRDSLREKTLILESTQRDLNQAQYHAKELEHTNQMEKEKLNKCIVKEESIQERLAQIQSENVLLRQQLEDAQNKGIIKEKVVSDVQVQFSDLFNKLRADSEKQILMVEERNKELISECNHLRAQMCKYENEKAEREATVRQLQQELADSLKKQSMSEASLEVTSRYRNDLENEKQQLQREVDQIKNKLQESEERHIQLKRTTKELEDHIQKLEIENAKLEATIKQQIGKMEQMQKNTLDSTSLDNEREKLKKLIELKQSLENRLEQEMKRNSELQKDISGYKKLLKTTKKKLKEYEKGDLSYQGGLKHTYSEVEGPINRLKNKIDDLTQQLEAESSKSVHLESTNRSLQEELFSMKILQKKCDKLEKNKRQLEEEVANIKHHLEINMLERSQVEQYKREIEERARQEIVEKLKEVNLFLQTQAASQENLEQLRENNNASIRNQMEHRIRDLESELYKMKNSQDSTEAELEKYRHLYSEESKIRKSLSNKLDSVHRTNEKLAEVSAKLLNEKQKNKTLINSFTASPILEPSHVGNLNSSLILNRSLIPRGNLVYSAGNTVPSKNRVDAYLAKMRQELEKNIAKELNEATAELESRSCRASPIGSTDESTRMLHLNQDPVSRATQEYLEVLKKNYML